MLNICDNNLLEAVFKKYKPEIVFHAAASKHVDLVEDNPFFAIKNNIIGTFNVLKLSNKNIVNYLVNVSTDKAANPINIMGMTKRCGEIITNIFAKTFKKKFTSVRFGNVIGSSGSFFQILNDQITSGGPITIRNKNATRYFMTIKDAANLVLNSLYLNNCGDVCILEMGKPINILEITKKLLSENNLSIKSKNNPNGDIKIIYTGLLKGEKLHEELFSKNKIIFNTSNKLVKREVIEYKNYDKLKKFINNLELVLKKNNYIILKKFLKTFIKVK